MKQKLLSFGGRTPRAPDRAQAAAAAGARRRRKRTGRQTLYYLLILLVAAAVVAVLSLTVFFRIEKLEVTGVTKYAAEEILEASGVKVGDNLFRVNARRVEKKLTQQFPYVEGVALRRTLPATLTLEIAQAKPLGAVSTAAGYVVIGKTGRVLEIGAASVPQDVMTVTGMYLYDPKVGQKLGEGYTKEETDEADKEAYGFLLLSRLMDAVEETDFGKVSLVDFSNQLDMMLVYDNRLLIDLGGGTELPYKLRFAKKVIEDELSDTFEGQAGRVARAHHERDLLLAGGHPAGAGKTAAHRRRAGRGGGQKAHRPFGQPRPRGHPGHRALERRGGGGLLLGGGGVLGLAAGRPLCDDPGHGPLVRAGGVLRGAVGSRSGKLPAGLSGGVREILHFALPGAFAIDLSG